MSSLAERLDWLDARVRDLSLRHQVPGVSVAVQSGDEIVESAQGTTNVTTGYPVTPNTRFLIGSVSKLFTAALMMRLADRGLVEIDAPVSWYLPELSLGDAEATRTVTTRQLLTHSSGIDGDYFADFGRGEDALERYVASLGGIGQIHPVGAMFSYCNTGFVIAGRVVEKVSGRSFRAALREDLLDPLGMTATVTSPEEAILGSAAVGHELDSVHGTRPVATYALPYAMAPAGSILCTTARELLTFARFHIDGGRSALGQRLLSVDLVAQMQEPQIVVPNAGGGTWIGLAWGINNSHAHPVLSHGGGTTGQSSLFNVVPDSGVATAILTNAWQGRTLADELAAEILERLGVAPKTAPLSLPSEPPELDLGRYVGTYESTFTRVVVELDEGRLFAKGVPARGLPPGDNGHEELHPIDATHFVAGDGAAANPVAFLSIDPDQPPAYLYVGRVCRRVADNGPPMDT